MSRRLVPLTDEIKDSSLFNIATWENGNTSKKSEPEKLPEKKDAMNEKVKDIVTRLNKKASSKFNIFATKSVENVERVMPIEKRVSKEKIVVKIVTDTTEDKEHQMKKCLKVKECKTIEMQKALAAEVEKNVLKKCLNSQQVEDSKKIEYKSEKNISIETLKTADEDNKPQSASQSPSMILPNFPTRKMLSVLKTDFTIQLKEDEEKSKACENSNFNPREMQEKLKGELKIFKRGDQHYVKVNENGNLENEQSMTNLPQSIPKCRPRIHIVDQNFAILTSKVKKIPKLNDLSLGKPYGIQLGLRNLKNENTLDLKELHAVDIILVAQGMACIKHPANWNNKDLDHILLMGAELCRKTKNFHIDRLKQFTKGFPYQEKFIQVTCSEPIVVGKIVTTGDRSMDLYNGLHKFFASYRKAYFSTSTLDLYIMAEDEGFFVFDPRGRDEKCERNCNREAALMAFSSINNVYHLIINLSNQNHQASFKICDLKITRMSKKINETEDYSAQIGNPNVKCRSDDFERINDHVMCLTGTVNLNSKIFAALRNRHGLMSSIMSMVYSKIDPTLSWCTSTLDRVMHFGYKMHMDCLQEGNTIRNLTLPEIPSKFYVGDSYLTQICIVPYVQRAEVKETRVVFDNPIAEAILNAFQLFRFLILEVDNYQFALWKSEDDKLFFFFDGYQKTIEGYIDPYLGFSILLTCNLIDYIIEIVINRLTKISNGSLKIHGLKIIYLRKLSKQESMTSFKLTKENCIRPFSADDVEKIKDAPSTVDSLVPLFTKSQLEIMSRINADKPLHLKITDLNSPSLVCCKRLAYHEIMRSIEKKLSTVKKPEVNNESVELMYEVQSEILRNITGDKSSSVSMIRKCASKGNTQLSENCWTPCGEFVGTAEKVLLKTDLDCLMNEREEILNSNDFEGKENDCKIPKQDEVSHFKMLPDRSQIVYGTKSLFKMPLNPRIFDYENFSLIVAVSAILISTRYKITSWSTETIDYVLGCGGIMSNSIDLHHRMDFYTHEEHILPKIHLNKKFYDLTMVAVCSGSLKWLEKDLKKIFTKFDRFIIATTRGSIAVFNINGNFYLFEYATCNRVGYRVINEEFGVSCLLSFDNIHSLFRRINANHGDFEETEKYLIYRLVLNVDKNDAQKDGEFLPFTPSKEDLIIECLRNNQKAQKEQIERKLKEHDAIILEEKERIRKYRDDPIDPLTTEFIDKKSDFVIEQQTFENQLKPIYESWYGEEKLGFMREVDEEVPKIKGSFGYSQRNEVKEPIFKACHFACVYSVMFAVHHAFENMNYRSIDVTLENGLKLFETLDIKQYSSNMTLKGIHVDRVSYNLFVREFVKKSQKKLKNPKDEAKCILESYFANQKYGILQGINCCMTLVKDKNSRDFQLFDPYADAENTKQKAKEKFINDSSASWMSFRNLDDVLEYASKKFLPPKEDQSTQFKVYQICILERKTIKAQKAGYFLLNPSSPSSSPKSCEYKEEKANEEIEWLMKTPSTPWSRLEKFNFDGLERYQAASKFKEYDIEIERNLFSLWGNIHPNMKHFKELAGKQHAACCTMALIISQLYHIDEWNSFLLDSIVIYGTNYLREIVEKQPELKKISIENLNGTCSFDSFTYQVNLQLEISGQLYEADRTQFNLNRALDYSFREKKLNGVVLICAGRILSIGFNAQSKSFFMYDSQSLGEPLFKPSQGTTYVLKCCCMKILLSCIVLTLNIRHHGVKFHLYSVNAKEIETKSKK